MVTPVAIAEIGYQYFIVFTVISFCIPASVWFFYPETMGQSLEQINAVFRDNKTPRAIVRASVLLSKSKGDFGKIEDGKAEQKAKELEYTGSSIDEESKVEWVSFDQWIDWLNERGRAIRYGRLVMNNDMKRKE